MPANPVRLLIVDDNPRVRENLAAVLRLAVADTEPGLEIIGQAGDGREAVDLARTLQPDAILMDLDMPVMDGFEATRRIKSLHAAPRVIILSVHASPAARERAQAAGADGFVVKGVPCGILLEAILGRQPAFRSFDQKKGENT